MERQNWSLEALFCFHQHICGPGRASRVKKLKKENAPKTESLSPYKRQPQAQTYSLTFSQANQINKARCRCWYTLVSQIAWVRHSLTHTLTHSHTYTLTQAVSSLEVVAMATESRIKWGWKKRAFRPWQKNTKAHNHMNARESNYLIIS